MAEFYRLLADRSVGGGPMQGDASALLRKAIVRQFPGSSLKRQWVDWAPLQVLGAGTVKLPVPGQQPIPSIEEFLMHSSTDSLPAPTHCWHSLQHSWPSWTSLRSTTLH